MCKSFFDKVMCVSRKTCKVQSCKSKIEGIMIGAVIGTIGGVVLGMWANSDKGRQLRNKMMCNCLNDYCGSEENE